jgi:hypothetical protein
VSQACQSRARTKAAYRFFQHPETEMEVLLEPHCQATVQRLAGEKVVLAVQDTTSLSYSTQQATDGLGPIGSKAKGPLGLWLHSTLAFNLEGTPLGLLEVQCWARDGASFGKKHERRQRPLEEKESFKWLKSFQRLAAVQRQVPAAQLVSVGDRESDIYELFQLALAEADGPRLLIRAEQDRLLADGQGHLWPWVEQQPVAGLQEIQVPRRGSQPARLARLQVRFAPVNRRAARRDWVDWRCGRYAGPGSGSALRGQSAALDAAHHLSGRELPGSLRKTPLVHAALGDRSLSSHLENWLPD